MRNLQQQVWLNNGRRNKMWTWVEWKGRGIVEQLEDEWKICGNKQWKGGEQCSDGRWNQMWNTSQIELMMNWRTNEEFKGTCARQRGWTKAMSMWVKWKMKQLSKQVSNETVGEKLNVQEDSNGSCTEANNCNPRAKPNQRERKANTWVLTCQG